MKLAQNDNARFVCLGRVAQRGKDGLKYPNHRWNKFRRNIVG